MNWTVKRITELTVNDKFRYPNKEEIWHLTSDKPEFIFARWYRTISNGKSKKRIPVSQEVWVKNESEGMK